MLRILFVTLALGPGLLTPTAQAEIVAGKTAAVLVQNMSSVPRACPALFGDTHTRDQNAADRLRRLDFVAEEDAGTTIAHRAGHWREPARLKLRGLRLVRTRPGQAAVFQVSEGLARSTGCSDGTYAVGTDAALGGRARVLAILKGGVLVEHGLRLGFIALPQTEPPRWLLAWRPRILVKPGSLPYTYIREYD